MQADTVISHQNDPRFRSALRSFQKGDWKSGMAELNQLMEAYPLDHDLRLLRQEMQLRAKIDLDEAADRKQARLRRMKSMSLRLAILVVVAGLVFVAVRAYSVWFQGQLMLTQQNIDAELRELDLASKFSNAQGLLQAGRASDARDMLQQIYLINPDYPGLAEVVAEAERMALLEGEYDQALKSLQSGDLPAALATLEGIYNQEPNFKDVALLVERIQNEYQLSDLVTQAEQAYGSGDWEKAVSAFEMIQTIDPEFQKEYIELRLYDSYVNAAEKLLVEQPESLEALQVAEDYFKRALSLRPQDEETRAKRAEARQTIEARLVKKYVEDAQAALIGKDDSIQALEQAKGYLLSALALRPDDPDLKLQAQMAQLYLQAQDEFVRGRWDEAINALEFVYANEPNYALGTALQTLYESYIARGDRLKASGKFDEALADFQRAAVLAQDSPEFSEIRMYEAQVRLADVSGILGNYDDAVTIYESALGQIELEAELQENDPERAEMLQQAENLTVQGKYRNAYLLYKDVTAYNPRYALIAVEVKEGEYLTQLANRYGTTISVIQNANQGLDQDENLANQVILIPVEKEFKLDNSSSSAP